MSFSANRKIVFNRQEYLSPVEFPAQAWATCQKTSACGQPSLNKCLDKIIVDGHEIPRSGEQGRRFYEDIMSLVENNGHVTLPVSSDPLFTSRQLKMLLAVVIAMAAIALAVVAKTLS